MNKVLIITEGQTEQIFIRNILFNIFDSSKFSINCIKLISGICEKAPFSFRPPVPLMHFEIINVQNDQKVLSYIRDNAKKFFKVGYNKIIGLRDMYSKEYDNISSHLDKKLNNDIKKNINKTISKLENSSKIKFLFAIMEIEAWFLAMYTVIEKLNCNLNREYILKKLRFDIRELNPEEVFKPSNLIIKIYSLVGSKYDKSEGCIEALTKKINYEDFNIGIKNNRCVQLEVFLTNC